MLKGMSYCYSATDPMVQILVFFFILNCSNFFNYSDIYNKPELSRYFTLKGNNLSLKILWQLYIIRISKKG